MPSRKRLTSDRNREWVCVLYPDNPEHQKAIEKLEYNKYPAIWILHDKDLKSDKEEYKKAHYHVYMKFSNPRYWLGLAKDLGIEQNLLWFVNDFWDNTNDCFRYMVHAGYPDRYQYPESFVKGDELLRKKLHIACMEIDKIHEVERVEILIDYIENNPRKIRWIDFVQFANKKGFYSNVRNATQSWLRAIDEHNDEIFRMNQNKYDTDNPFI